MRCSSERGYAMAALLVALSVMSIMLGMALPAWRTMVQREREAELVWRGEQYMQAISLFSRRTGGFPTSLAVLRDGRFIRKLYKDPITNLDFQPVYLGQVAVGGGAVPGLPGQQPLQGRAGVPPVGQQQMGAGTSPPGRGLQFPGGTTSGQFPGGTTSGQFPGGTTSGPFGQTPAAGPIIGVSSRSTAQSLRLYNGRGRYNEWLFVATAATNQPGVPGGAQPPGRGRGPQPGRGRGPGFGQQPIPPGPGPATPFGGPNPLSPFGGQRGRI